MNDLMVHSVASLTEELRLQLGDRTPTRARDVVAALMDAPRFWPSAHADETVSDQLCEAASAAIDRLQRGAPFAYAVRRAAFRHLTLTVDERVLIPRPETELLIDEVLRLVPRHSGTVVDIGTGSGAIALALATEANFSRVIATDLSLDALAVAEENAAALAGVIRTPVEFRHGSFLEPVQDVRATAIVSNPPYIAPGEERTLPASVRDWEPPLALFSGDDGMAATAEIVREAAELLEPHGVLALEVDSQRAARVAELVMRDPRYEGVAVRLDLTQRDRFVVARRRPS